MFKGFQDNTISPAFLGFPSRNFQQNMFFRTVYGFPNCSMWLSASQGLSTDVDLSKISVWKDFVRGIIYSQETAASQPRLIVSDPVFNNQPVVDFNAQALSLIANTGSLGFSANNQTIVLVYQYLSANTQQTYTQSRVISDGDWTSARNVGVSYSWITNIGATGTGFYIGGRNASVTNTSLTTTQPYIMIISKNVWLANGSSVTPTTGSITSIPSFGLRALGGPNGHSGIFKLAEVVLYEKAFDSTEAANLSAQLNSKYLLY
jgi:hypothetical protein